jgi:heme A synthase
MKGQNGTRNLIYFNAALALFIILWGAWVRLSGSGAGCGDHWPLCQGEVIPTSASLKTIIEFTHRLTSGLFGITVLMQVWWARKEFGPKHLMTKGSLIFLFITVVEALLGAVLVKKGLVEQDDSVLRAWVIGAHLVNTLLLLGSLTWCWCLLRIAPVGKRSRLNDPLSKKEKLLSTLAVFLFLIVGAFGAIAALGNTLFPSDSLVAGLQSDFDEKAPFLIRLRIYHPILAVLMVSLWFGLLSVWKEKIKPTGLAQGTIALLYGAVGFGFLNWILMAPTWGALLHLFIADLLWMLLLINFWFRCYRPYL